LNLKNIQKIEKVERNFILLFYRASAYHAAGLSVLLWAGRLSVHPSGTQCDSIKTTQAIAKFGKTKECLQAENTCNGTFLDVSRILSYCLPL